MYTFLIDDGTMALRLGKEEREAFMAKHDTELVVQYGAVMREFVVVPAAMLDDIETLAGYLQKSYDFVDGLPPKPKKKKKK